MSLDIFIHLLTFNIVIRTCLRMNLKGKYRITSQLTQWTLPRQIAIFAMINYLELEKILVHLEQRRSSKIWKHNTHWNLVNFQKHQMLKNNKMKKTMSLKIYCIAKTTAFAPNDSRALVITLRIDDMIASHAMPFNTVESDSFKSLIRL